MSTLLTKFGLKIRSKIGFYFIFQLWLSKKYFHPDMPYLVIGGHNGEKYYLPLFESDTIKNSFFSQNAYFFLKKNNKVFRLAGESQTSISSPAFTFHDFLSIKGTITATYEEDYYECGEPVGHYNIRASLTFTARTECVPRYGMTYGIHVRSMKTYSKYYNSAKRFDDFVLCNDKVTSESLKGTPYYKPYTKTITFDTQISEAAFENENDGGNYLTEIQTCLDDDLRNGLTRDFVRVAKNQNVTNFDGGGQYFLIM